MTEEFFIPDDQIRLHAKMDFPEGFEADSKKKLPLLIVVHGFTGHMEEAHILGVARTAVTCGMIALRVEMYGHGRSDGAFRNHTLYKWISNLLAVIDYAKALPYVGKLYLAGHSQGGLLTMMVGGMRVDDLEALLPLSPAWMIPDFVRRGEILGTSFDPDHIPEVLARPNGLELKGDYLRVAMTLHVEDEIDRFHGPVLIVQGEKDEAVPLAYAKKAQEKYENAKLVLIEGDSHCFDHHLDLMLGAVKDFLQEVCES